MNTINQIHSYTNLRNYQNKKNSNPNFQGKIGEKVVKEITTNKTVTVASILAMVGGFIGLSKDKVSDVLEELTAKIKSLMDEKVELESQNLELKKNLINTKSEKDIAKEELEKTLSRLQFVLQRNAAVVAPKDAKIAELQKYEGMAKVKSVDELDIVSPEQFVELLNEAKENQAVAEQSLLNYLFNGNGQEEFLAQMERSNKILKAKKAGITKIPEMLEEYSKLNFDIGDDSSVYVAQNMMKNALINDLKGTYVNYPPIKKQIIENANAIINPMKTERKYPDLSNEEVLNTVSKFHEKLASQKEKLMKEKGLRFEQRNVNSKNKSYYTFVNDKNHKFDIYLGDLASGLWGYGRWTYPDGSVDNWTNKGYWE